MTHRWRKTIDGAYSKLARRGRRFYDLRILRVEDVGNRVKWGEWDADKRAFEAWTFAKNVAAAKRAAKDAGYE